MANSTMSIKIQNFDENLRWNFFFQPWLVWLFGLIISILPLLVVVILKYIDDAQNYSFEQGWNDFLGNKEIFYVYVSLAVAAFLGVLARSELSRIIKQVQEILLIIIMLLAAMLYVHLAYKEVNGSGLVAVSLIFLGCTFVFGTTSFIGKIKKGG
jgi:hypothetical protein